MANQREMVKIFKAFKSIELHPKHFLFKYKAERAGYDDFNSLSLNKQRKIMIEELDLFAKWYGELEARKMITRVLYCLWDA